MKEARTLEQAIKAFSLNGHPTPLQGGQNTSVRVGEAVLKPVEDAEHFEWLLSILDNIQPTGYRIARPIRNVCGELVSHGWIATRFEPGREYNGRIKEKLQIARMFHKDLSRFETKNMVPTNDRWSRAHRIAWQCDKLPVCLPEGVRRVLAKLLERLDPTSDLPRQLVHGDLAGNILFHEELSPLVIDFSPTIAPVEYAEAILVCDCIAWQGSPVSEVNLLPNDQIYKQMILRAIVFRLSVEVLGEYYDEKSFERQYRVFKRIIDYIGY